MKKLVFLFIAVALVLTSCVSEKDFFGVWYVDNGNERNVIQFSESADGKNAFYWVVKDIANDETVSISKGYFKTDNRQIVLTYLDGYTELTLSFKLDGEKLTLSSDSASMVLTKYE